MDTLLYDHSIPVISQLQSSLAQTAPFMELMSKVFDPKYAFLIYSPLAYLLDPKVGKKLIMTTVLAEWLNQILKWFLHGERPYWYVHSSGHFNPQETPIKQFPITCELGPGHPSGHAMVTAAVWYIILSSLRQHIPHNKLAIQVTTWTLYAALLSLVSLSRVFLGCHFPHQCLAGAVLGLLLARSVSSVNIRAAHFVEASFAVLATALSIYGLLEAHGFDPSWTIRLATTHCVKRDYLHLDTAPFFSIMRYSGFALGCGLGLMFPLRRCAKQLFAIETSSTLTEETATEAARVKLESDRSAHHWRWFSFKLLMGLLMARLVDNLALFVSHDQLAIFYSAAFAAYTLFSYAFINL